MIKKIKIPELKNKNFLIIPIPLKDELLTSWMIRTAYAHKTHPHTFTNLYFNFRPHAFFLTEPDITLTKLMINTIEKKTYNKIDVQSLMLKTYSGYLQEKIYDIPSPFITHLKFCPVCLREDQVPYFRKKWRLIFYNICHKHKCRLYEHCPSCKKRLNISKMYNNELPFTYCGHCGFELRKSRRLPIHKKYISSLKYQNEIFKTLHNGYIVLGHKPIYSFLFFKVFLKLSKLILLDNKVQFINKHPLYTILKTAKQHDKNHPIFHRVNSKVHSAFFGLLMYIFDNYPNNLKTYITQNKLTYYDMTDEMRYVSFWYENIVNTIIPRYVPHSITITKQEVQSAKKYLQSMNKEISKTNLSQLFGCNFFSKDNNLNKYL